MSINQKKSKTSFQPKHHTRVIRNKRVYCHIQCLRLVFTNFHYCPTLLHSTLQNFHSEHSRHRKRTQSVGPHIPSPRPCHHRPLDHASRVNLQISPYPEPTQVPEPPHNGSKTKRKIGCPLQLRHHVMYPVRHVGL